MDIKILSGVCIVKDRKILLLKQSKGDVEGEPGGWGPPAGHGEDEETIEQTAIRETKEESNLDVKLTGIVECGLYKLADGRNYLMVIYAGQAFNLDILKVDNNEIVDHSWFVKEQIQSDNLNLRHPILRPIILKAIDEKISPIDSFKEVKIEVK